MKDNRKLYFLLAIAFAATYSVIIFRQTGIVPTLIIVGSMIGGMICWRLTTYHIPADPKRILPVYLLTLSIFALHVLEEYLFHFAPRIAKLLGNQWTEKEFIILIMFVGPVIWIGAAAAFYYRNPFANFIVWFLFFGMLLGEPTHVLVFPLLEGGRYHYFPGMWTALLPMVTAAWGVYLLVKEYRVARDAEQKAQS